jgi:hypothetical protein
VAKLFIAGHWSPAGKYTTLYCGPDAAKAETIYKGCDELGEARLYVNPMPSRARKNKPPRAPEPPVDPAGGTAGVPTEPPAEALEEPPTAEAKEEPRARSHHRK